MNTQRRYALTQVRAQMSGCSKEQVPLDTEIRLYVN